jgi:hypothetical protein
VKPSALRIERLLAKVEAELARSARPRRYCFYRPPVLLVAWALGTISLLYEAVTGRDSVWLWHPD